MKKRVRKFAKDQKTLVAAPTSLTVMATAVSLAESAKFSRMTSDFLRPSPELAQLIESFLLDQRSPHTRLAYGKDLKRFFKFLHFRVANLAEEKLSRAVFVAYKEYLIAEKLQATTIDRHLATLKAFFGWLVEEEWIEKNPVDSVRFLNPKRISKTLGFSDEEVLRILDQPNPHLKTGALHKAILSMLFYCGLRRSELVGLKTSSIQMDRGHRVLRLQGKGNMERVIPLVENVWNDIRNYLILTRRSLEKESYLFLAVKKFRSVLSPMNPSAVFYIVRKYSRMAGVYSNVSPHSCRATAISNARDHDVPDRAIQEFAGWSSPDMIVRYDKRKTAVENSAALAINYDNLKKVPKP